MMALMALNEVLDRGRDIAKLQVAASAQLMRDVFRHIFRPALRGVEGYDAEGVAVLTLQKARDCGLQVRILAVRFNKCPTRASEIILD
jgi:hypothetical protein